VTGDSAMAKNFKIVVTGNDNSTISATSVMYFGSVFHFAFRVNTTGQYKVTITYLDAELPKGKIDLNFCTHQSSNQFLRSLVYWLSLPSSLLLWLSARERLATNL
jgi:hypothetical protein